jgi:hypothetical protein
MAASTTSQKMKNAIMIIDLEKAFDIVDHIYLWKSLAKFNFPERFIDILKHLYQLCHFQGLFELLSDRQYRH